MFALVYNIVAIPFAAGVWYPLTRTQVCFCERVFSITVVFEIGGYEGLHYTLLSMHVGTRLVYANEHTLYEQFSNTFTSFLLTNFLCHISC